MVRLVAAVALLLCALGVSPAQNTKPEHHTTESHNVTTDDGYILELFRIKKDFQNSRNKSKKVVFLMHGYEAGYNSFTYGGSKYGMADILADAGYDVWMGNARGNKYSRRHVTLDPDTDKRKFFDFTYEDIALHDLPASIDYVLNKTRQEKLHYIGHSLGGTVFYVLTSMRSQYQSKIASAHLLSGVGYENDSPNAYLKLIAPFIDIIYSTLQGIGVVEIPPSELIVLLLSVLAGSKPPSALVLGAGVKPFVQIVQNIRDKSFRRWNYGSIQNLVKYGNISPPAYDLSIIKVPTTVHYSASDTIQSEADALAMAKAMPNATARKVPRESFKHIEYATSPDAKEQFIDFIIKSLNKF